MDNKTLANGLQCIAQGQYYNEDVLYHALKHPVSTSNDCIMLRRHLLGSSTASDRMRLQDLSINILHFNKE